MNKCIFIGNLTMDPDNRTTTTGKMCTTINIAVNEGKGERKTTYYIRLVAWEKLGELCSRYLKKGSKIMAECKYTPSQYKDETGKTKTMSQFTLINVEFLGGGNRANNDMVVTGGVTGVPVEDEYIPF